MRLKQAALLVFVFALCGNAHGAPVSTVTSNGKLQKGSYNIYDPMGQIISTTLYDVDNATQDGIDKVKVEVDLSNFNYFVFDEDDNEWFTADGPADRDNLNPDEAPFGVELWTTDIQASWGVETSTASC